MRRENNLAFIPKGATAMRSRTAHLIASAAALMLVLRVALIALPASAADPLDQAQPAPPINAARPMAMKEPMAGEMKKDGMMKEDVSKAAAKWSKEMDEKMKQEKMK
jgi:hypothetical protein